MGGEEGGVYVRVERNFDTTWLSAKITEADHPYEFFLYSLLFFPALPFNL